MKKLLLFLSLLPFTAAAQPPAGYYNNTFGRTGETLRAALYNIIKGHTELTYTPGLWSAYSTTDNKPNTNKIWAFYSDKPGSPSPYEFTIGPASNGGDQCGSSANNVEGDCYNREHIWPQSKFGGRDSYPMYSDLWIAYPNDYYVNTRRGDMPYGKVGTAGTTFLNGSKIGNNTYPGGSTGSSFEPIDSFKGDIARSYFYITTRYLGDSARFIDWEMATKSTLKPWVIQMLLEWHHLDPVSDKEIRRNNAAYALQRNRNPFIDYPQFADCIWAGNCQGLSIGSVALLNDRIHAYPNPATSQVQINWAELAPDEVLAVDIVNLQGQVIYHAPAGNLREVIVPVSSWAKGIYLLQVRTQHGTQAQKLVVQ